LFKNNFPVQISLGKCNQIEDVQTLHSEVTGPRTFLKVAPIHREQNLGDNRNALPQGEVDVVWDGKNGLDSLTPAGMNPQTTQSRAQASCRVTRLQ
jgi:hypothetical protein